MQNDTYSHTKSTLQIERQHKCNSRSRSAKKKIKHKKEKQKKEKKKNNVHRREYLKKELKLLAMIEPTHRMCNYLCIAGRKRKTTRTYSFSCSVDSSAFLLRLHAFVVAVCCYVALLVILFSQQFYSLRWFVCNLSPMSARKKKHTRTAQCSAQIAHLKNETREMIAEISVFSAEWTRNYIQATFI